MLSLTRDEMASGHISCIDEMLSRESLLLSKGGLDGWKHLKIRCGRRRGMHISHQMRSVVITTLGDMHLVG